MSAYDWQNAWGEHGDGDLTEHGAYQAVSWVRRCVEVRCNALSAIPVKYYRGQGKTERGWEYSDLMPHLLWMTEAALQLYGAAYWLRLRNPFGFEKGFRWLYPRSVKPEIDKRKGLTGFTRYVNGEPEPLPLDQAVYVWAPNLVAEIGPGKGWVSGILTEAGVAKFMNQFASEFFERGAMPGTLLSVEGNPSREELDRLEQWWRRMLQGVKRAWESVAVRATVKPVVVGYPTDQLAMPELLMAIRQQIAVAAGVPQTMLEDAANYACLPGDQLVWTPDGPTPIMCLGRGDHIWQMNAYGITENVVDAIIPQPIPATIYQITTPHRTLRASDNHPIMCVEVTPGLGPYQRQGANLIWKRADQIAEGDLIVTVEELPDQGQSSVDDIPLTEEFMEIAGLYMGDGDGSERDGLRFAIPAGPLQDYYAAVARRVFEPSTTRGEPGRGRNRDYGPISARQREYIFTVGSKRAYKLFRSLGLTGKARTKTVPGWVFAAARPLRLAFLRGYLDADGTVGKDGRLAFGACNKALIHQIRALCVSCGIPVSNVTSDTGRMGNYGPIELHRFICGYAKYNRSVGSHDERYIERLQYEGKGSRDGRYISGSTCCVWNLEIPDGLGVERVKSVVREAEPCVVYDLCTHGSHTFIAEGIVVHNTAVEHHQAFYSETVVPEATIIEASLNQQIFEPQGLRCVIDWQSLDIFQADEAERGQALAQYTSAGVPLYLAMELLGIDLPNEMTYEELRALLEEERAQAQAQALEIAQARKPAPGEEAPPGEQREEMRRWQRKSLKAFRDGKGAAVDFDTDALTIDEQATIRERLAAAQSEEEVRAAFAGPFRRGDEGFAYP